MNYEGKLYGRFGNKYFDTGKTSADWDALERIASTTPSPAPETTFEEMFSAITKWQDETFPRATPTSCSKHLLEEAKELSDNPYDIAEAVDCLLLIMGYFNRSGMDCQAMLKAVEDKMQINYARKWDDKHDERGYVKHLPESPAHATTREELIEKAREKLREKGFKGFANNSHIPIALTDAIMPLLSNTPKVSDEDEFIKKLDGILQPAYGNSVYAWFTIEKAVRSLLTKKGE